MPSNFSHAPASRGIDFLWGRDVHGSLLTNRDLPPQMTDPGALQQFYTPASGLFAQGSLSCRVVCQADWLDLMGEVPKL